MATKKKNTGCIDEVITVLGKEIGFSEAQKVYEAFKGRFQEKYKDLPAKEYNIKECEHFVNYVRAYYKVEAKK